MTFQTNSPTLMPAKITSYTVLVNCVLISHVFHYRISLRSLSILVSLSIIKLSVRFHYKFQWLHCMFIQHLVHTFWQTHHNITALVDSHALPCQKSFKYAVLMLCQLDQLKLLHTNLLVYKITIGATFHPRQDVIKLTVSKHVQSTLCGITCVHLVRISSTCKHNYKTS